MCFRVRIYHIIVQKRLLLKYFSDICISMGRKRDVILCLFDLNILHAIGINGSAVEWFRSYFKDRTTTIKLNRFV